jgi:putative transposase
LSLFKLKIRHWSTVSDDRHQRVESAGLTRSMSKKGCSPDNSACEGFFGHLKTEMFYGRNWDEYTLTEFIKEVDAYMHWYCKDRIKTTLGGISPLEYRRRIGVAV